ncbi:MAG TPA: homoserine kinase [Anaeromyxobacter sp.]|nr:homoserine kinase [Anaeromyxobacter sp.]
MAEYTVLDRQQLTEVLAHFGLAPPSQVKPEPKGAVNTGYHVWSGGHRYFLRVTEGRVEADVRFEAEAQAYLHAAHFPVPALQASLDGRHWTHVAGKPAMLFAYAPGEELLSAAITADRCRRLGEQMGRLHELAAGFAHSRPNPFGRGWVGERLAEIVAAPPADAEAVAALPLLEGELDAAARLPGAPAGLVHGDLFVDNVLWIGDRVSAVLDWEMSCTEPFAYDLGVALNAWCWAGGYQTDRALALWAGYRGRRKIEPETAEALYEWSRFAALRFAVARLRGYVPAGAAPTPGKDWREYRDRLSELRAMGEPAFRKLLGI